MPARPGQPFQPVLPGMGRVARKAPSPVAPEPAPAWNDRRDYRGPQPGQLVMGVSDLAHENQERNIFGGGSGFSNGHYEVNEHGYVREGRGVQEHDAHDVPAHSFYSSHGGRFAKTAAESAAGEGTTPSELGMDPGEVAAHDQKVGQVKKHWNSQPTVQFPTDALVHTAQSIEETEGDAPIRETMRPIKHFNWRDPSQPPVTQRTAGGTPMENMQFTEDNNPGNYEGRSRVEKIKEDLRGGRTIKKPIWMMKVNGRHFQLDGHHRMVAAREAGQSHVPVKMWDLDAARSTPPPPEVLQHAVSKNPALAAHMHAGGTHANMLAALRDLAKS